MPVRYSLLSVWLRQGIFSPLSYPLQNRWGLCVFSWPISLVMIERIYILCLIIIIKSEVWTITHCLGLGHETMVCAVCLPVFLPTGINHFMYESIQWGKALQCNAVSHWLGLYTFRITTTKGQPCAYFDRATLLRCLQMSWRQALNHTDSTMTTPSRKSYCATQI